MSAPPPGVNMPKKKDPRMRALEKGAGTKPEVFDSADYEVKKQAEKDPKRLATMHAQATRAPHTNAQ